MEMGMLEEGNGFLNDGGVSALCQRRGARSKFLENKKLSWSPKKKETKAVVGQVESCNGSDSERLKLN